MATAADEVKKALEFSKKADSKDSITILGHTLKWEEWEHVAKEWSDLREIIKEEKISSAFLYSLLAFARMWKRYRAGDVLGLRYHPLLSYSMRRNVNPRNTPGLAQWTDRLLAVKPGDWEQGF